MIGRKIRISFLDIYDLNRGFKCKPDYVQITSSWQDCKKAAESLGYAGDNVAHVDHKNSAWDGSRPRGCFQSDGRRFHFNEGAGGYARGNDHILCIQNRRNFNLKVSRIKMLSCVIIILFVYFDHAKLFT